MAWVEAYIPGGGLRALGEGGVRGVRFTCVGHLGADAARGASRTIVEKVIPLGWHAVIHFDAHRLAELAPFLRELPLTLVIDHMGRIDASAGVEQEAFRLLLELMEDARSWVQVSGSERIPRAGQPFHAPAS